MSLGLVVADYALPFRRPFVTASGTHTSRKGWLLRITDMHDTAIAGYGEAAPLPGHGGEDPAAVPAALGTMAILLADAEIPEDLEALAALDEALRGAAPDAPCARAAVSTALADAAARRAGLPLARWLRADAFAQCEVNATIGAMAADAAAERALSLVNEGFRTLKLKLGDGPGDGGRAMRVRDAIGRRARLRGDANGAWSEAGAGAILRAIGPLDLEYVEQPVAPDALEAMHRLRTASPVPVAADEALLAPHGPGPEAVLAAEAADVWVLKPALLGGPMTTLALADRAASAGIQVVITTALDAAVGRAMAAHVAAALPGRPHADGLATGGLLEGDVAPGLPVSGGRVQVFDEQDPAPGLGLTPHGRWHWEPLR